MVQSSGIDGSLPELEDASSGCVSSRPTSLNRPPAVRGPQSIDAKYGELRIDSGPSGPQPSRSRGSSCSSCRGQHEPATHREPLRKRTVSLGAARGHVEPVAAAYAGDEPLQIQRDVRRKRQLVGGLQTRCADAASYPARRPCVSALRTGAIERLSGAATHRLAGFGGRDLRGYHGRARLDGPAADMVQELAEGVPIRCLGVLAMAAPLGRLDYVRRPLAE